MADLAKVRDQRVVAQKPVREFLVFTLADELYGVELTRIREILSPPPVTEVPRAPRDVIGVCSVRGLLVTVLDLRRRMSVSESPPTRRTRILLASAPHDEVVGLLVDEVRNVVRLSETEIEVATSVLGGDVSEHVFAVGRPSSDSILVLLDLGSVVGETRESAQW